MNRVALLIQTTLFIGVLALGISLGAAIGLAELQASCIAAGGLPTPGTAIPDGGMSSFPCWPGAKRLQWIANRAGAIAGLLLIGGAVLDRYDDHVREVIA